MKRRDLLKSIPLAGFGAALPGIALAATAPAATPAVASALAAFNASLAALDQAEQAKAAAVALYLSIKPEVPESILSDSPNGPRASFVTHHQIMVQLRDHDGGVVWGPHRTKPQYSVPMYVPDSLYLEKEIALWRREGLCTEEIEAFYHATKAWEHAEASAIKRSGIEAAKDRYYDAQSAAHRACVVLIETPSQTALDVALKAKARKEFYDRVPGSQNLHYDGILLGEVAALCGGDQ